GEPAVGDSGGAVGGPDRPVALHVGGGGVVVWSHRRRGAGAAGGGGVGGGGGGNGAGGGGGGGARGRARAGGGWGVGGGGGGAGAGCRGAGGGGGECVGAEVPTGPVAGGGGGGGEGGRGPVVGGAGRPRAARAGGTRAGGGGARWPGAGVITRAVPFFSAGLRLDADLHLPGDGGAGQVQYPVVIACSGYQGQKVIHPARFARALTPRGYAVLAFDYRGFGSSEGPRGRVVPQEQAEDVRAAV